MLRAVLLLLCLLSQMLFCGCELGVICSDAENRAVVALDAHDGCPEPGHTDLPQFPKCFCCVDLTTPLINPVNPVEPPMAVAIPIVGALPPAALFCDVPLSGHATDSFSTRLFRRLEDLSTVRLLI